MLYDLDLVSPFNSGYGGVISNRDYEDNVLSFTREGMTTPEGPVYGLEVEYGAPSRDAFVTSCNEVFDTHPIFIVKDDGSIPRGGGEIVTLPLELNDTLSFADALAAKSEGFTPTDACGIHIHTARPNNVFALARTFQFVNSPYMSKFIDAIALRKQTNYCVRDCGRSAAHALDTARETFGSHSSAVSRSRHGTLEYRIFASTTQAYHIKSYVEFVNALTCFVAERSVPSAESVPRAFAHMVDIFGAKRWPSLYYRMRLPRMRGIIAAASLPDDELFKSV